MRAIPIKVARLQYYGLRIPLSWHWKQCRQQRGQLSNARGRNKEDTLNCQLTLVTRDKLTQLCRVTKGWTVSEPGMMWGAFYTWYTSWRVHVRNVNSVVNSSSIRANSLGIVWAQWRSRRATWGRRSQSGRRRTGCVALRTGRQNSSCKWSTYEGHFCECLLY